MIASTNVAATEYVLDANIFIEAKRRYYAFDVCPGFWDALVALHGRGRIMSIDRVRTELTAGNDELAAWATTTMPDSCFFDTALDAIVAAYREGMTWVMAQSQFTPAAKAEFARADNADAWVVAFAKAVGATVVTHEAAIPASKSRVPIPNVCEALQVPYTNTFDMLRALSTRFRWDEP